MFSEHVQSRAERREATRGKVLASAERLFRERGFGATTVRQIAADAEVSTGTVMAVAGRRASQVFLDLALALLTELTSVLSRTGLPDAEAARGGQTVYFAYLGLLMTAANGVLDVDAAVAQFQEIVRFVVRSEEGEQE